MAADGQQSPEIRPHRTLHRVLIPVAEEARSYTTYTRSGAREAST